MKETMTKIQKKRALKRFLQRLGFRHLSLIRIDSTHAGDYVPHGYEGWHGKRFHHWTWIDFLDCTRTSAGTFTLGNHLFCFLAPDYFAEQTHPSMPLVDLSLGFLVDALDGTLPITSSRDRARDFWDQRQFIDVDDFSFERLVIEMDVRQGTIENGVASNVW